MQEQSDLDLAKRFGQRVRSRRVELGLTQAQVSALGGPSAPTLKKIEEGDPATTIVTLYKLDTPLQWRPGSAERARSGDEPELDPGAVVNKSPLPGPDSISLHSSELTSLMALVSRLNDAATRVRESDVAQTITEELDAAVAAYTTLANGISARYATALLEHNGGPGRSLHPLVEIAFAHLLDVPATGTTADETTERLYRRWLAGRPVTLDAKTERQFRNRWTAAVTPCPSEGVK